VVRERTTDATERTGYDRVVSSGVSTVLARDRDVFHPDAGLSDGRGTVTVLGVTNDTRRRALALSRWKIVVGGV
jgi:hypothetical protein